MVDSVLCILDKGLCMQTIYLDKRYNDKASVIEYGFSNLMLMENAGNNLAQHIAKKHKKLVKQTIKKRKSLSAIHRITHQHNDDLYDFNALSISPYFINTKYLSHIYHTLDSRIVFLCGSGDNGADGLVAARILHSLVPSLHIIILLLKEPKSTLCKKQYAILQRLNESQQSAQHITIVPYYDFFEWHYIPDSRDIKYEGSNEYIHNMQHIFLESLSNLQDSNKESSLMQDNKYFTIFSQLYTLIESLYPHCTQYEITQITHYYAIGFLQKIPISQLQYGFLYHLLESLQSHDMIIDCIFGSGFSNNKKSLQMSVNYQNLKRDFQKSHATKIACDMPSGLPNILGYEGDIDDILGYYDDTLAMGGFSLSLFDSRIKDHVGKISLGLLGMETSLYRNSIAISHHAIIESDCYADSSLFQFIAQPPLLLEKSDMALPLRHTQNSNKGSYGTSYIIGGTMSGATLLAAKSAQSFGSGKVCVYQGFLDKEYEYKDCEIIYTMVLPDYHITHSHTIAFAIGMGLGYNEKQYAMLFKAIYKLCGLESLYASDTRLCKTNLMQSTSLHDFSIIPISQPAFIFDADILYRKELMMLLPLLKHAILTPHPKEFLAILQHANIVDSNCNIAYVLRNIPLLALQFSQKYPHIVCLIKGANTVIVYNKQLYIHILGQANLAKGGSGDVLSGMIVALLAQGMESLEACLQASLAHAIASKRALKKWGSFALTPLKLIESFECLLHNYTS